MLSDGRRLLPRDPVQVVDLRGPRIPRLPHDTDRILLGLGPVSQAARDLPRRLDLTVVPADVVTGPEQVGVADPQAAVATLRDAVTAAPVAATVLADLLRWSGGLAVSDALDAESFAYSTLLGGDEFAAWLRDRVRRPVPEPAAAPVVVARTGDELRLTLNRPERRNAYGRAVRDALVDGLDVAVLDPSVRRVVLDGAGPAFCAGGDLDEFGTAPDPVTAHLVRTRGGAARRVHALADRVEVRLHGPCVGAGVEIAAFAGRVVAAPGTTLRLPELGMGLVPGAGGTVGVPRRIGRWRLLYLALSGVSLDAGTALVWGLVDAVAERPR